LYHIHMRPKKIKKMHHRVLLVSLIVLFITMYVVIFQNKYAKSDDQSLSPEIETNSEEYTSSFLGFTFLVPVKLQPNESGNTIQLHEQNNFISISRLFGYSNVIEEYLNDLAEKNKLEYNIEKIEDNGFYVVKMRSKLNDAKNETSYIKNIDTDTFVSISTTSPELYDELEQIAASFEYLDDNKD